MSEVKTSEPKQTFAVHGQTDDGLQHIVGLGNLRVVLLEEDGVWFAQSLDIDYAAQGDSIEDVKSRFSRGLFQTVKTHITLYGSIEKLLRPAPAEVWKETMLSGTQFKRYTQVGMHKLSEEDGGLPYDKIEYLKAAAA
jgi:hypothetical protein